MYINKKFVIIISAILGLTYWGLMLAKDVHGQELPQDNNVITKPNPKNEPTEENKFALLASHTIFYKSCADVVNFDEENMEAAITELLLEIKDVPDAKQKAKTALEAFLLTTQAFIDQHDLTREEWCNTMAFAYEAHGLGDLFEKEPK